ncbi:MAG: hypothetical protein LBJ62_07920 [Bifidobacteriaceae bacterium]|jgi:hypothetical protein|nr:hypothetical protein [Bifidobacteriaceae bacterium]
MTESLGEFFQPGLGHLAREKERQRHDIHEFVVDAPPFDSFLDQDVVVIEQPAPDQAAS